MLTSELMPKYESVKSYYNKAKIVHDNNKIILVSYYTPIIEYNTKTKEFKALISEWEDHKLTQTTMRHVREFMQQLSGQRYTKKRIYKQVFNK